MATPFASWDEVVEAVQKNKPVLYKPDEGDPKSVMTFFLSISNKVRVMSKEVGTVILGASDLDKFYKP